MIGYWAIVNSRELMTIPLFTSHQISDRYSLVTNSSRHSWDVPISVVDASYLKVSTYLGMYIPDMQVLNHKQSSLAMNLIIGPTMWASKAAILTLLIRIFGSKKWLRLTCYGLLVFTFFFYWSIFAMNLGLCVPPRGGSLKAAFFGRCAHHGPAVVLNGVFGVVTDLIIFALPFPIIARMNLGRKKKIGLTVVFSVGVL